MALQAERLKSQAMSGAVPESRARALWERLMQYPKRWGEFLHEVRVEMRQVTWPARHEVVATTFVVIVAVAFFGVFFFGVDSAVGWALNRMFSIFKR